jgi:hypothetical protein
MMNGPRVQSGVCFADTALPASPITSTGLGVSQVRGLMRFVGLVRLTEAPNEEWNEVPCLVLDEEESMSNAHQGEQDTENSRCRDGRVVVVVSKL